MASKTPIVEIEELAPIENLAFEGGGVKGIVYVGAIKALEEAGALKNVKRVGGSSAGGITALLLGLGYSYQEILKEMTEMDFGNFQDSVGQEFWRNIPNSMEAGEAKVKLEAALGVIFNKKRGAYKGDAFLAWAQAKVAKKLGDQYANATFADIEKLQGIHPNLKQMMFTGTNISGNGPGLQIFDAEHTPNVRIVDAVRATMSFPGAFEAHKIKIGDVESYFVDGGAVSNHPMEYYDQRKYLPAGHDFDALGTNPGTLGLRVDTNDEIQNFKWFKRGTYFENNQGKLELRTLKGPPDSVMSYVKGLVSGLTTERLKVYNKGFHAVQIPDRGVKTLNFLLTKAEKEQLLASGEEAAKLYLKNYRENAIASRKVYKSFVEKYQDKTKNPEQLKSIYDRRRQLRAELDQLTAQLANVNVLDITQGSAGDQKQNAEHAENRSRLNALMAEISAIDTVLAPFKKSKEEEVNDKIHELIRVKENLAVTQHMQLLETFSEFQTVFQILKDVGKTYSECDAAFEKIVQSPENAEIFKKIFDKMNQLQNDLKDMQAQLLKLTDSPDGTPDLASKIRKFKLQIASKEDQGIDSIRAELTQALELESVTKILTPEDKKLVEKMIASEIEGIKERSESLSFEQYGEKMHNNLKENDGNLSKMQDFMASFKKQVQSNHLQLQRLQLERKNLGNNLEKMQLFTNKLNEFIKKQDSGKYSLLKMVGGSAIKVVKFFTYKIPKFILYDLPKWTVKKLLNGAEMILSEAFDKKTYNKKIKPILDDMSKTIASVKGDITTKIVDPLLKKVNPIVEKISEHSYHFKTTIGNSIERAEQLKNEIYNILNEWSKETDSPAEKIEQYRNLLEGVKYKLAQEGTVLFSRGAKKELGHLIDTELTRIAKEHPQNPEQERPSRPHS